MENKKIFYINLIYYLSLLLVAVLFVLGFLNIFKSNVLTSILIQVVVITAIPILLYSILVSKSPKQTLKDFGFKKLNKQLLLISIGIAIVLYFLNIFVATSFNSLIVLFGYDTTIPALNISNAQMLKEFALTACLPGLCEEVLHRGMLLNGYKKQGLTRYGLIISSIMFGLMHLNIVQFFYATILGFFIGLSVLTTESIWTGVIIHFTNNFLSVYFSIDKNLPFKDLYTYIINGLQNVNPVMFVILITGVVLLLLKAFSSLIKMARKIKFEEHVKKISEELNLTNLSQDQAQEKVDILNKTLSKLNKNRTSLCVTNDYKLVFKDKIFVYASLILGGLATLFSFICGIL